MPPKSTSKAAPTGVDLLKARVQAQREAEEKAKRETDEEDARLAEEARLAEIQRKDEEEEKKLLDEAKKKHVVIKKAERQKQAEQEKKLETIERMRAAGCVMPDEQALNDARGAKSGPPKPAPKKKPAKEHGHLNEAARALVAEAERKALDNMKSETDVSSDEDEPDADPDEEWEEMEARRSLVERNVARAGRRRERVDRIFFASRIKKSETDVSSDEEPPNEGPDALIAERNAIRDFRRGERAARKRMQVQEKAAVDKITEECAKETQEKAAANAETESVVDMRAPICCILGHVDTGKTSLLDRIRSTNVQGGEAGGITQQIGATYFPHEALFSATEELNKKYKYELKIPGLLVIDTPGHEAFSNLRSRGSALCDIAVLVIDIMHGIEPQTRESIKLLRDRKCPFLVALNKVDRCLDWVPHENMDIEQTLALQKAHTRQEFEQRSRDILVQLNEEGYNAELYWRNANVRNYISVIPTSAKTGEGICDLLLLKVSLVQRYLEGKVTFKNELQCTILEVKPIQGLGTTIDAVLVNGVLNEGDKIVCCGMKGPIETQIKALLTPQPMRELRIKSDYIHHTTLRAAMGVKIVANDLDDVVPGTPLFVVKKEEDRAQLKQFVVADMNSILNQIDRNGVGVTVQSSTLGALEALLSFLKDSMIPVAAVSLGPLHKKHVHRAVSMRFRNPYFGIILAFDVPVTKEAREFADKEKVPIFEAKIIYHLFDMFEEHMEKCEEVQREKDKNFAVFPVQIEGLTMIRDRPMTLQGTIVRGHLHKGTPLCTVIDENGARMKLPIGVVQSIEKDDQCLEIAGPGVQCAFKLSADHRQIQFGRQFAEKHILYSNISRESIDALKTSFMKAVSKEDWDLVRDLKDILGVQGASTLQAAANKK